ncbi:myb-like protein X [Nymphalis io]|uniref:myb-like protein X n=1 Tax=Inachis io TaxID=171585 RepID=UPI00216A00AE|nr:myb-like protein X [Nymphalis io]
MEVGAVKQAFNNEIILLKKNLNQAKIQTIHKLTRKAKTLTDKKGPEALKEKQKRKAESAVREVLIIKKIKARDIARFIVTHTGNLNEYLNKPIVDENKACARLLLHKSLQEKYKHIREKFLNISIKDLFMSRQERKKLKKEEREKQKNKKKGKNKSNIVNVEGEWDVENTDRNKDTIEEDKLEDDEAMSEEDGAMSEDDGKYDNDDRINENGSELSNESNADDQSDVGDQSDEEVEELNNIDFDVKEKDSDSDEREDMEVSNKIKNDNKNKIESAKPNNERFELKINGSKKLSDDKIKKVDKKIKDNKNKNLNEKLHKRKFNKESDDLPEKVMKIVDPFFVTSTGENYMSLVEPRNPDEVKEVHKEGNRKYRRAVMFGHVPKIKPKKNNYQSDNNFNKYDKFENKSSNKGKELGNRQNNFKRHDRANDKTDLVPEKLHPSWEAKKKQSGLLPFEGKKIVFD